MTDEEELSASDEDDVAVPEQAIDDVPQGQPDNVAPVQRTREEKEASKREFRDQVDRFRRGSQVTRKQLKGVSDKKLKSALWKYEKRAHDSAHDAAAAAMTLRTEEGGFLEPETEMEKTFKMKQEDIRDAVDEQTAALGSFALNLERTQLGPYMGRYSRSSRSLLVCGRKGHAAVLEWRQARQVSETFVNEKTVDCTFLHNDSYYALAQRKYVYIYDSGGIELHVLRHHSEPTGLAFLPHHFLLASLSRNGSMRYTDTTTGSTVADVHSNAGVTRAITVNPYNACVLRGHRNGTVTMWSPVSSEPLASVLCHRGPVNAVAVDRTGRHMVTTGLDGRMKIWDVRTYQELHSFPTSRPAEALSISQRGLLAVGFGPHVQIWKDVFRDPKPSSPYLNHLFPSRIVQTVEFCPFEDFLGVGHSAGFSTLIVPGAGEPNLDSSLPNPFESKTHRREFEVTSLLDKLAPESITLDPSFVGKVEKDQEARVKEIREKQHESSQRLSKSKIEKKRARGRNKIAAKLRRKQKNVVDAKSELLRERLRVEREERKKRADADGNGEGFTGERSLQRFHRKPRK